jgi:hypothetical protein
MFNQSSPHSAGRGAPHEVTELEKGMDFRLPEYRRETFLRFYEFHLKYRSHPGAVYQMMPYIVETQKLDKEQRYWFAYINGLCQHAVTTWTIFKRFPDFKVLNIDKLSRWFRENYPKLGWDTDRRYVKNQFEKCVMSYKLNLRGKSQTELFEGELANTADEDENFRRVWRHVMGFELFGRLSTFSYLEYLRIMGLNIDCDQLFLDDIDGSKSHRNGLCKVNGRDDLDWHDTLNPAFRGYNKEIIDWLKAEGHLLLNAARMRLTGNPDIDERDVGYFTLESTLCCYKSWHRENRRYPNVYMDMFYNRIKTAEEAWAGAEDFSLFWDARRWYLPPHLRIEDNPRDPGLVPRKQNHYRLTGQVIMMHRDWPCFENDFNKEIDT